MRLRKKKTGCQRMAPPRNSKILINHIKIAKLEKTLHTQKELDQCNLMIGNIAESIKTGSSVDKNILKNQNPVFKSAIKCWKEDESEMNLLQLATLYRNAEVVDILNKSFQFNYDQKLLMVKYSYSDCDEIERLKITVTQNKPLHLACRMGFLNIVKLLLSSSDTIEIGIKLREKSIVHLEKVMQVHSHLFRTRNQYRCGAQADGSEGGVACEMKNLQIVVNEGDSKKSLVEKECYNLAAGSCSAKTALEICSKARHLECCIYLADLMFESSHAWKNTRENVSLLHKACYLQNPTYLELLLKENRYRRKINSLDFTGKHALLIALKSRECVEVLLQNGANPRNIVYRKKSLLMWLITEYSDLDVWNCELYHYNCNKHRALLGTSLTSEKLETARLLLRYGADVNYWKPEVDCCNPLCHLNKKLFYFKYETVLEESLSYLMRTEEIFKNNENVNKFISLLLESGAKTVIKKRPNICAKCGTVGNYKKKRRKNLLVDIDRTAAHTFLEFVTRCSAVYIAPRKHFIFSMVKLLLEQGALDTNVVPVNSFNVLQVCFSYIRRHLEPKEQRGFLHLLYINGADFNTIPKPNTSNARHYMYIYDMNFFMLPLVKAFWFLEVDVLLNIMQFMSATAIQKTLPKLILFNNIVNRKEGDLKTILVNYNVRTLCHLCKLVIISCIGKQGRVKVKQLFIPEILKMYLLCNIF